jgi:hypothetical protein
MPKSVVSWVEYHIRYPEKLEALSPEGRELFWKQREWHPMVQMLWNNEIRSTGEGMLIFPNGVKQPYDALTIKDRK